MPYERVKVSTSARIPETDSVIHTPTCDCLSIWTERYAIDFSRMPSEREKVSAISHIP